jgi:alkylation response protein AidB-like acyl-CoA dehydrogenase
MNFELTADQLDIQARVADFADREIAPVAEQLDRDGTFPYALYRQLGDLGIASMPFAEEFGGLGLGTFDMALAIEQIAKRDQTLAVSLMVSVSAGLIIQRFGTAEQKARYLPEIAAGRALGALAGTEADAGSDTAGFKTRAVRKGDDWIVNGSKAYITNAGTDISSVALTLAVRRSSRCSRCRAARPATRRASPTARWAGAPATPGRSTSTTAPCRTPR